MHTLRLAVERLPLRVRAGMLAAVQRERIITGAYVKGDGICPLLGAHRYGSREGGEGFADAWDGFCGVRPGRARDATEAERTALIRLLRDSLFAGRDDDGGRGASTPIGSSRPARQPPRPVAQQQLAVAGRG
jgi:hypothetical protein